MKRGFAASAFAFVMTMGIVNLFADMTYEGGASINGPFLGTLGASAAAISIIAGAIPRPPGSNHIIVSHRPNLQDTAGKEFGDLSEAEVVVFRPLGNGKYELVTRVAPVSIWKEWSAKPQE